MNDSTREAQQALAAVERVQRLYAAQRAACLAQPYPSADERLERLKALKRQTQRYQDLLAEAMSADFGFRPAAESKMLDLLGSVLEANHAISHLKRWMKPSQRSTELLFLGNSVKVMYQPKGVVGVIVPWNFPIYLAMGPLVTALAAGNRVMIKMSEVTPADQRGVQDAARRGLRRRPGRGGRRGTGRPERLHLAALRPHRLHRLAGGRQDRHAHRGAEPDAGDAGTRRQVAGGGHAPLPGGRRGAAHHARQVGQLRADLHRAGLRAGAARERRRVRRRRQDAASSSSTAAAPRATRTSPASSATGSSSASRRCWPTRAPRAPPSPPARRNRRPATGNCRCTSSPARRRTWRC